MTTDAAREIHQEFSDFYLNDLINYVVFLSGMESDNEVRCASGVLVNVKGRHFVATAEHCVRPNTVVMKSVVPVGRVGHYDVRRLRILGRGANVERDIAYLEIEDPRSPEIQWEQLCSDRIIGGMVEVVGFPRVLAQFDSTGRNLSVAPAVFSTTLRGETDECQMFEFPVTGYNFNPATGDWESSPFPGTPHGFSGGGCFGVERSTSPPYVVKYKLLGIQYEWDKDERYIRVMAIKHWCDLLDRDGIVADKGTCG
jgi:hypothetical protein